MVPSDEGTVEGEKKGLQFVRLYDSSYKPVAFLASQTSPAVLIRGRH